MNQKKFKVEDMTDKQLESAGRFGWWSEENSEKILLELEKRNLLK